MGGIALSCCYVEQQGVLESPVQGKLCDLPEAVKGRCSCPVAAVLCTIYAGAMI